MSEKKSYRIPSTLLKAMERDRKQKGLATEAEYVVKALEHFLTCSQYRPSPQMRLIVLKYDDTCLRCHKQVKAGNWALWAREVGVICMDCYVERIGDKATVAKYLKLREWRQTMKALKNECERYAQRLEDFRLFERLKGMDEKVAVTIKAIMEYITAKVGTPEEQEALEEIIRQFKELRVLTDSIRELYKKLTKRKGLPKVYA